VSNFQLGKAHTTAIRNREKEKSKKWIIRERLSVLEEPIKCDEYPNTENLLGIFRFSNSSFLDPLCVLEGFYSFPKVNVLE
jgi:hypothetical protein